MIKFDSQNKAQRLLDTISFELDTDMRLLPHQLKLGKTELLTDALTLPYADIESRLQRYAAEASESGKLLLRKDMKDYLARLNANPLIPLDFRLKVLARFEHYLDLFDPEMTAAILNAHKIGVLMVHKEARNQPNYLPILADMIGAAIELATRLLVGTLQQYQLPSPIATRQCYDLIKVGLAVLPTLRGYHKKGRIRLLGQFGLHELLRRLDLHGKSAEMQLALHSELGRHLEFLEPVLVRKGDAPPSRNHGTYLLSNMVRPHELPEIIRSLPATFADDVVLLPLDRFIEDVVEAVNRAEALQADTEVQKRDLHIEEQVRITLLGGNAILDSLRFKNRPEVRVDYPGVRLLVKGDADRAIIESRSMVSLRRYEVPADGVVPDAWAVTNISQTGVGIERVGDYALPFEVGSLVGLVWLPNSNEPMLGFVRWIKEMKPGEHRVGIEFFTEHYHLIKGSLPHAPNEDLGDRRAWSLLLKQGTVEHTVIFPDAEVEQGMAFDLYQGGRSARFQIAAIIEKGPNYTITRAVKGKEIEIAPLGRKDSSASRDMIGVSGI